MIYTMYASNALNLVQAGDTIAKYESASDILILVQSVTINIKSTVASNQLKLKQTAVAGKTISKNITQYLSLSQVAYPHVHIADVHQLLFITQQLRKIAWVDHKLNIVQSITFEKNKGVNQNLTLVQTLVINKVKLLVFNQSLNLRSAATATSDNCNFIGQIIENPPTAYTNPMIFQYGSLTLTLPPVDFENSNRLQINRVNRQSRGGDLIVYRDPTWPKSEIFLYRWSSLKEKERDDLLTFVKITLGKFINITDYENRTFLAVIRTPAEQTKQPGRELFEASFEIEVNL